LKEADAYFFDEPSAYLDIRMRMRVAEAIREFIDYNKKYVIIVDHDLMFLDYVSDYIAVVYGEPGVYGIVSNVYSARAGINHYLDGYLPSENMRIRSEPIRFQIRVAEKTGSAGEYPILKWTRMVKTYPTSGFKLVVEEGEVYPGMVVGIVGPNGIGKSTFINILGGQVKPDEGEVLISVGRTSFKPQEVTPGTMSGETVAACLREASPDAVNPTTWIYSELVRKLGLNKMLERRVDELSGGELQKLAVATTLAREADLYLLDEPSAYLDVEERIAVARVIRRLIEERRKTAFIVEHDLMMLNYICDKVMVFTGKPSVYGTATQPLDNKTGFNELLRELDITVRKDPQTGRPRVNKPGSYLDREQKNAGNYYAVE